MAAMAQVHIQCDSSDIGNAESLVPNKRDIISLTMTFIKLF
jgi:hypothetical protein